MIFVRYKGGEPGSGKFTRGKTYIADTFEEGSAVILSVMGVKDDDGTELRESTDSGRFDFMNFVYAVVVVAPSKQAISANRDPAKLNVGDVVKIDQVSLDGKMFRISGLSVYYDVGLFDILDWTTVVPGMRVMRLTDKKWKTIQAVNDSIWFRLEDSEVFISPEMARFAVSGGGVAMEPFMRYVGDDDGKLKCGAVYPVAQSNDGQGKVLLRIDAGSANFTRWVEESRLELV